MSEIAHDPPDHAEAELQKLRLLVEQLRQSEIKAQRNSDLLEGIIDRLPVCLTVRDEAGQLVLVNRAASTSLGMAAEAAASQAHASDDGKIREAEEMIAGPDGQRTMLTSCKTVRILDETLQLATSYDITERKRIEGEMARRAYFDELTGLANRAMIQEYVENMLRSKSGREHFALAFIDLDNFKHINDYYSHAVGDALLVKVAQRVTGRIRETDMLARISGDEFVLLVSPVESDEQLHAMIDGLLEELKRPFHIEGFEVFTSASIGVSVFPEHGRSYEELRRNADSAMYRVKSDSKGGAAFFDLKMGESVSARMELEQRLRLAIRDRQFSCAFQPKVDIRSQQVIGFETLIRWRHDQVDIQPPGTFIGLATELGLIDPITYFVLGEAIQAVAELDAAFGPDTAIAVNVAARQAGDVAFMSSFVDTLKASGYGHRFIVEVTEDAFVAKNRFQTQVIPMLRELGTRVSIDDFGTGYSSLSVLADITADEIKVDRSFITAIHQRPRSQSILKAIESISSALGMSVVAEGVETFEELAYLQAASRIRYAQGFHFSKPFFLDDMARSGRSVRDERRLQIGRGPADGRVQTSTRSLVRAAGRGI